MTGMARKGNGRRRIRWLCSLYWAFDPTLDSLLVVRKQSRFSSLLISQEAAQLGGFCVIVVEGSCSPSTNNSPPRFWLLILRHTAVISGIRGQGDFGGHSNR
jgi:hypothetical protein